jgi:plasmid stabilization system protein ParE
MIFKIKWKPLAANSYLDEMDFILSKWNELEVQKFDDLVYDYLNTLSKSPEIGRFDSENNCYSLVISKQTTLYYKIIDEKSQIDLVLFWNNSQNLNLLSKLLQ